MYLKRCLVKFVNGKSMMLVVNGEGQLKFNLMYKTSLHHIEKEFPKTYRIEYELEFERM